MFDIYTEIVPFMPWINETIMRMGGMQACDIKLDVTEPKGLIESIHFFQRKCLPSDNLYFQDPR